MFSEILKTTETEKINFTSGQQMMIPKVRLSFDPWTGKKPFDDYNGKPLLKYNEELCFAEIAILRILENSGWNGVWVDSYRRKFRNGYWNQDSIVELPESKQKLLDGIYKEKGSKGGCWDVFCWKEDNIGFVEAKRAAKDKIRKSQIEWLEAAIKSGINQHSFLIVEWDINL